MIVAGIDPATRTGLAILEGDRLLHWEAHRPKGTEDAEIFHGFRTWLRASLIAHGVEYTAIEEPLRTDLKRVRPNDGQGDAFRRPAIKDSVTSMATYLRLYGIFGHATEVCFALNIPVEVVHQATWRKSFLGTGRGDKDMALAQCKRLGWDIKSKDAAEAAGIAFHLCGHLRIAALARPGELFAAVRHG